MRRLVESGHDVVALVRQPERAGDLRAIGVRSEPGDITDRASVDRAMRGAEGIFHCAAWYRIGARGREQANRINVEGTRNVLEAMRDLGVAKGVYTSTVAVFGDTHGRVVDETYRASGQFASEYDRTKYLAHYEVAEPLMREGLPLVIVQPGVIYGENDHSPMRPVLDAYLRRRLPAIPGGTAYCWAYVEDTVDGHVRAMDRGRPGESYVIAGPPHTLGDALRVAERVCGIGAPRLEVPPALLRFAARVTALLGQDAEGLRVLAGVTYLASSAKAERELGWSARPLADGLARVLPTLLP